MAETPTINRVHSSDTANSPGGRSSIAFHALAAAILLGTALAVPLVRDRSALAAGGVLVGVGAAVFLFRKSSSEPRSPRRRTPIGVELALHLSPVALLTVVFPLATVHIARTEVGGVSLSTLLLASSLTVPWLSQVACMPLYRGIGSELHAGDLNGVRARFCAVWPLVGLRALPVVALFAVPVQLVMHWPLRALGVYLALSALHLLFAQALVLTNMPGQRPMWAVAWGGYAAVLLAAPQLWFLPPVVGLVLVLVPLRRHVRQLARPVYLDRRDVLADMVRGLLLGAVLWADKWLFFLTAGTSFAVNTVFLALLPAVLAYNLYFVMLAPQFDSAVAGLRSAMEREPLTRLHVHSNALWTTLARSIGRTGVAGAALTLMITCLVGAWRPEALLLSVAVSVASWFFMMTTVVCYKLDYIGQKVPAQAFGLAHLIATVAAFAILPTGPVVYFTLAAVELVIFIAALRSCLRHWELPEYTLFWRHATSW